MKHKFAFAGFSHPHILSLWRRAKSHSDCQIVAAWEPDPSLQNQLRSEGEIELTDHSFSQMLKTDCTVVAIGDVYARRGELAIAALRAGKHVISDKPICTALRELEEITSLAASRGLSVGCQLDLVESGAMRQLRNVIRTNTIGEVCTLTVTAQHPLRFGQRAAWYFEPGMHGGTINDIGIHLFDLAPWLIGCSWKEILVAREWNAKATSAPHFKDCAQFLATMENGASCFADLSYLAPDKIGYEMPHYWRITAHGTKGMAEASYSLPTVTVATDEDKAPQYQPIPTDEPTSYLQDFLDEIAGTSSPDRITTKRVLASSRQALTTQAMASAS